MKSVLETCIPRQSILQGAFNPEVFTAALSPVIDFYRSGSSSIDAIYTDARAFFCAATYPTDGLRQTVSSVFRRIAGDQTAPSIYRLETAFGGGKTHSLIACVHIAYCGSDLAGVTESVIDRQYLPQPRSVTVAGIAGDEIPVTRTKGDRLIPYTLWGEMAFQIGGEDLYRQVREEAESFSAPGRPFFDAVFGGKKALILLDELAQYAARLEAAVPNGGSDQLAAFLMSLNGYAKTHAGIALIVTLAGAADAFSRQTENLRKLLAAASGSDLSADEAAALAEQAARGVTSVTMRDATAVTPVQANEISSVLAKRLFQSIDGSSAEAAAREYAGMYRRSGSLLPEDAANARFQRRMISNYPFHPTLIDFLNNKLAQAENFQGTRGVLRVLAMTVRSIWNKQIPAPVIQVGDIDLQNSLIVDELLGRTASADLRQVLNTDVGSAETHNLHGGLSTAQRLDQRNPHPDGLPLYEKTWKTVFLNSLVGRAEGHASKLFGVSQKDAIFETATPLLTPAQIKTALDEISESACYLRCEDSKYFAHLTPTINSVLAMIRQTIGPQQVDRKLRSVAQGLLGVVPGVCVENNAAYPQDIGDGREQLTIAVIDPTAEEIDPREMITKKGDGIPRQYQNAVLLLAPKSVKIKSDQTSLMSGGAAAEARKRIQTLAQQMLAIETLKQSPQAYGIPPGKVSDNDFRSRETACGMNLCTSVYELYTALYCPDGCTGGCVRRELQAVVEGDAPLVNKIMEDLRRNKLIIDGDVNQLGAAELKNLANQCFFPAGSDRAAAGQLLKSFFSNRGWPMLKNRAVLEQLLRRGVEVGAWVAYKLSEDPADSLPGEIYDQKNGLPLDISLLLGGYFIMTPEGAKKRGWLDGGQVSNERIKDVLHGMLQASGAAAVGDLVRNVQMRYAAPERQVRENIQDLVRTAGYEIYQGPVGQRQKPDVLVDSCGVGSHDLTEDDVLITQAEESQRGWLDSRRTVRLCGNDGARKLFPILRRLGSMYTRGGGTSTIDVLDIRGLQLRGGGQIRLALEQATPESIMQLDELLQALTGIAEVTDAAGADLEIKNPDDGCALVRELKK